MYRTCVAVLGAAALAMAGCGEEKGSSKASGGAGKPLTKAQFIARADAVCRDVKRAQLPFTERVDKLPDRTSIARVAPLLEGSLAESRAGLARLRALPAPRRDKAALDAYFGSAARLLEAHRRLADAARTNDREAGEQVARTTDALSHDQRRLATAYGFKDCDNVF